MIADIIIPARGGSKGVPRKNLLKLGGVPLVARAVRIAQATQLGRVIVSTEDAEIAGVAEQCGAEIVQRPVELATDGATSDDVLLHAIEAAKIETGIICMVQCTSPLMTVEDILSPTRGLCDDGICHTIASCGLTDALQPDDIDAKRSIPRRQERNPQYELNGTCWAIDRKMFLRTRRIYGGHVGYVVGSRRFEIDTPEDWAIAQALDAAGMIPPIP